MASQRSPYTVVAVTTASYSALLYLTSARQPPNQLLATIKTISASHSLCTTLAALSILTLTDWPTDQPTAARDATNPLIAGRSALGNALTSFETGYLLYDTGALLLHARRCGVRASRVMLAHHAALLAALAWLQAYIARGREKGLRVIVALFLMNASNPLLHLRWWMRAHTGRVPLALDAALAGVFAASRFGVVYWLLRRYGAFHGLGPWQAYAGLRVECKTGTAMLVGLNAVWWLGLMRGLSRRTLGTRHAS